MLILLFGNEFLHITVGLVLVGSHYVAHQKIISDNGGGG